jgi:ABC-type oligopeptide transport system substrate-binding subunit
MPPMKRSLLLLPVLSILAALALSACGGGGSSTSGGDEEGAIVAAIEKSATTNDPSKCTELQTQAFNEQEMAMSGDEATEICEEAAEGQESPARSAKVSNVKIDGETATAEAAIGGSALDGQTVEFELVEEEGDWKLNQFLQFTKFNAKRLAKSFEKEALATEEIPKELATCISAGIGKLDQKEAEAVAFEGDLTIIESIAGSCE